tara:strand:+ start:469 stop:885 length:417 start_codon:yes stop_codon:yes gene_type:complete
MNDEDDEYSLPDEGLEMGASIDSETHDDVDPFEELGIGSRESTISKKVGDDEGYDALSDLMNDEEEEEETVEFSSTDTGSVNSIDKTSSSENLYIMLLQTVWVDGILDPAEVRLLAKKREELDISFERHLELVENLIG